MFDQYSKLKGYSPAVVTGKVRILSFSQRTFQPGGLALPSPDSSWGVTSRLLSPRLADTLPFYFLLPPPPSPVQPRYRHGSYGRDSAGGRGVAIAAREFLRKTLKSRLEGTTFAIQARGGEPTMLLWGFKAATYPLFCA